MYIVLIPYGLAINAPNGQKCFGAGSLVGYRSEFFVGVFLLPSYRDTLSC